MKKGIRLELAMLWRKNVKMIMDLMRFTQKDIASKIECSRPNVSYMLSNDDFHLTGIQFLGTLRCLHEMIEESDINEERKAFARSYWEEIDQDYQDKGLF